MDPQKEEENDEVDEVEEVEEVICSCEVKPYDPDDESTWKRHKYVNLHNADKVCCKTPAFDVEMAKNPAVPLFKSNYGLSHSLEAPVAVALKSSHTQPSPPPESSNLARRPVLVNGKLIPTRLSAIETQTSKDNRPIGQLSAVSTPARKFTPLTVEKKPITYSKKDRRVYGKPNVGFGPPCDCSHRADKSPRQSLTGKARFTVRMSKYHGPMGLISQESADKAKEEWKS